MKRLLLILLFVPIYLYAQNWVPVVDNDRQLIEVDFSSIKRNNSNVLFWSKTIYKKDIQYYIDKQIESLKRNGVKYDKDRWMNWNSTLTYQEFNCSEEYTIVSTIVYYNKDGSVISRVDIPEGKREKYSIAPNSLTYGLFSMLCGRFKYEVDEKIYVLPIEKVEGFLENFPNARYIE